MILRRNLLLFGYSFFVSIVAVTFAFYYQYIENYPPCEFCIYQRIPYFFLIIIIPILFVLNKVNTSILYIIPVIFLASLLVSLMHVGIEKGFLEFSSSCSSTGEKFNDVESLRNFLNEVPITKCNEIIWSYLGFSMAQYNSLFSFINFGITMFILIYKRFSKQNEHEI
tara:strand:- start:2941 stop:3444 length:504 start_codon:yes stop_codon:yes gene_type:complete